MNMKFAKKRNKGAKMNNVKKIRLGIILMSLCLLTITVFADTQNYHFTSPGYQIDDTGSGRQVIVMEDFGVLPIPGYPQLPAKVYNIALPPQADFASLNLQVVSQNLADQGIVDIPPLPPMAAWIDGQQVIQDYEDVYTRDEFFPASPVQVIGTAQMRKWRYIRILYCPFQYNPVTKVLRKVSDVSFQVSHVPASGTIVPDSLLADDAMDQRAADILYNYKEAASWYTPASPTPRPSVTYDYVIITNSAIQSASTQLSNFTSYLSTKGFNPLVVTESQYSGLTGQSPNGTAEKIRQWLINNYSTYNIEYVLLIGNPHPSSGNVPMKMCWPRQHATQNPDYDESPTDYFYADLTGDWDLDNDTYFGEWPDDNGTGGVDFANEVYVGRVPVYSGVINLDNILSKMISFGTASPAAISWRQSALLPMSFSDSSTDGAYLAEAMKTDYLTPSSYSNYTMYQQGSMCAAADSSFTDDEELLNSAVASHWGSNNYGMVWWWGHGWYTSASIGYSGCGSANLFNNTETSSLNDTYPAFTYQCSCYNGYPENSGNLGTALLRQGAVATVSASRVSWYAVTSWYTGLKYYCDNASIGYYYGEELVSNSKNAGEALYDVKSDMGANHHTWWGGSHWMNLFDFNLYGDPAMALMESQSSHTVSTPNTPSGPAQGIINTPYSFSTGGSTCNQGHSVEYRFDWGDGNYSSWSSSTSSSHMWATAGTYQVKAQARCATNNSIVSGWSSAAAIQIYTCWTPETPENPSPHDGAYRVSIDAGLDWDDCQHAVTYDVYFGPSNPPGFLMNVANSECALPPMTYGTQYYWEVVAKSTCMQVSGGVWGFVTQNRVTYNSGSPSQIIPETLWAPSANGGTWKSEVQITDMTGSAVVDATFYYGGGSSRGPFTIWTSPGALTSVKFDNILETLEDADSGFTYFGRAGTVEFTTQDGDLIQVSARTSNGDFSKTFQGLNYNDSNTLGIGREMVIQNLVNNADYRSAFGAYNPSSYDIEVQFLFLDEAGNLIGTPFNKTFVPHDYQAFAPFDEAGLSYPAYSYEDVLFYMYQVSGEGEIMCYGATANNNTNDPAVHSAIQFNPDIYYSSPSHHQVIPEVLWAPAAGGGEWQTEIQITSLTSSSQVSVYYNSSTGVRRGPITLWTGCGNCSVKSSNILAALDGLDSGFSYYGTAGTLEFVTQDQDHRIQVIARTSNGDYSKSFQGLNVNADNCVSENRGMMLQNLSSDDTYRTAVGAFNPAGQSVTVNFDLFTADGSLIGNFSKSFSAYEYKAFNPFNEAGYPYPSYSYDNVWMSATWAFGDGSVMLYGATANDNTNDPAIHRAIEH
jgi:hypothetical protein